MDDRLDGAAGAARPLTAAPTLAHSSLPHSWNLSTSEAVALQKRLATEVVREDRLGPVRRVAGVDVGYGKRGGDARAAVVVLDLADLTVLESVTATRAVAFPYVPGLLSFREAPVAIEALGKLRIRPDLLLCDGQGIAHPRRLGIASHLGLLLDIPSIGVAKSRLIGTHEDPGPLRGDRAPLMDKGEVIGAVLRTRPGTKPIYVSLGHRVGLETAVSCVMRCTTRFRLPETTRAADRLSKVAVVADV
jgi:deoxyribonuclease V